MNQRAFQSSEWWRALTLKERLASFRATGEQCLDVQIELEQAEQRLDDWRAQPPFDDSLLFARCLEHHGVTEAELLSFLGESSEAVKARSPLPPDWLKWLTDAFSRSSQLDSFSTPEDIRAQEDARFLGAIEPLIRQGRARLHAGVQSLVQSWMNAPFNPTEILDLLFARLPAQLGMMMNRTMVLELNVARLRKILRGDSPEERFQSFLERIRQPDVAISILQEYPVLARQLVLVIDNWVECCLEFLQRLCVDWKEIRRMFCAGEEPGQLVQVRMEAGDRHRGGRAVMIASFSSGFTLVYKPKPLAVDSHFQQLLAWVNERASVDTFRLFKILDRGSYGWVEFISAKGCESTQEIERFYERQGSYLALLYTLEATDFHFENLIAAGEYPVLIDLESLFQPRTGETDLTQSEMQAGAILRYSTMRVGLLPQRVWSDSDYDGIDVSGLGGVPGQLSPHSIPYWEAADRDEMRLELKRFKLPGSQNRPSLTGRAVDVLDYAEALIRGFAGTYRLLREHRDELLANGLIDVFAEDEIRIILRPTRTYGLLLRESFHPDVLHDALDRDAFFDQLWRGVPARPLLAKAISSEREDLLRNDIPLFTTRPDSRHLWSSSQEQITDFFSESGMTLVKRRLEELNEDDLQRQIWFIRASLTTLAIGADHARWPTYIPAEPQSPAGFEQLISTARAIGDRIEALAIHGADDVAWIGLAFRNERNWTLAPLGPDLYSGASGIALFLAYLGEVTGQERHMALARKTIRTMLRRIERLRQEVVVIGGFGGWGGVIYTLAHLGILWREPQLLAEAEAIVESLPSMIERDEHLDVIGGAAGCIGGLISLYECVPSGGVLNAIVQCADKLLASTETMERGIGWKTLLARRRPLSGFSHGAAGFAWALLEAYALTKEGRFKTAAVAAIEYERSLYSEDAGNWADLREFDEPHEADDAETPNRSFVTTWCHGAAGIGLARLRALRHLDEPSIRDEINIALKTTLTKGFGFNHCLCHGDLGNLELFLQASELLDEAQWHPHVARLSSIILNSIREYGWLCGVPLGVETPGLLTGIAGIGYGLLRIASPRRIPSVLVLAPPRSPSERL